MMKKITTGQYSRFVITFLLISFSGTLPAQKIVYSEPEREDNRRTNFEIIGKVGANILVYKGNRSDNAISVYDAEMKLVERVKLGYEDDRWINVDFINYPDHVWMIYQFQRKGIVHCMGVKLNGNAKQLADPIEIDTTRIGWSANNKIYTTIFSDDKQKIMVFKVNNRNPKVFIFTTLLFDAEMKLQNKHRMNIAMEERNDYFTDFLLDNDGDMVFGKYIRKGGSDYITDLKLLLKKANADSFAMHDMQTKDRVLDEIKIKVDNTNKRYLFTAFYYKQKRGNVEGLYTVVWDKVADKIEREGLLTFNDDLRKMAKGPDANLRIAFNDYFINDIIIRKDGGYLLIGESMYTSTRGGTFNRWDYLSWNSPWNTPLDYYYWSPYYSPWRYPWNRWGNSSQPSRYHAENILVLSFDNKENLQWSNVITKSQYDDESDALVSYELMNTGGQLHFLFNLYERRALLLNDHSIGADGKITRHPTLKNLERGVEFMPRYGKQISTHQTVVPCLYRNYLTFAKIEF